MLFLRMSNNDDINNDNDNEMHYYYYSLTEGGIHPHRENLINFL
jgi:hypothetical protein